MARLRVDARGVSASRSAGYVAVVCHAIDVARPAYETWDVVLSESDDGVLHVDFGRATEERQSLNFTSDRDDKEHRGLFRTMCQLLTSEWPDPQRPM